MLNVIFKKRVLWRFMAVLALVGLFLAGYFITSVQTSCPAQAQICCNTPCIAVFGGTAPAIPVLDAGIVGPGVVYTGLSVSVYYVATMAMFSYKVIDQIGTVTNNWVSWWNTFWYYDLNPALQDMTRQIVLMDALQAKFFGQFKDMVAMNRAITERREGQIEAILDTVVSEKMCVASSVEGAKTAGESLASDYATAAPLEQSSQAVAAVGTPAAAGPSAQRKADYDKYCNNYNDSQDNAGHTGCASPGTHPNLDLTALPQSILEGANLKDAGVYAAIQDNISNITGKNGQELIPQTALGSATGQQAFDERQQKAARQGAISSALHYLTSLSAPVVDSKEVSDIFANAGLPPNVDASSMNALTAAEAIIPPDSSVRDTSEGPQNSERQYLATLRQAVDMEWREYNTDGYMALVLASQVGPRLVAQSPDLQPSSGMPK